MSLRGLWDKYPLCVIFRPETNDRILPLETREKRHFLNFNQILNVQPRMFNVFGYESSKHLFLGCYIINHINKYPWSCNKAFEGLYARLKVKYIKARVYARRIFESLPMHFMPWMNAFQQYCVLHVLS